MAVYVAKIFSQSIHLYENIEFRLSLSSDLGNALSIVVLSSPEMRSSFNRLLTALASFDLIYLFVKFEGCISNQKKARAIFNMCDFG